VSMGDFSRDGKFDLAVANIGSNNSSILSGEGDGTFQRAHLETTTGTQPQAAAA